MYKFAHFLLLGLCSVALQAQNVMTPELLWQLGRVSPECLTPDNSKVIYGVTKYDITSGVSDKDLYAIPVSGGNPVKITDMPGGEYGVMTLPDGSMGYFYKGQIWSAQWDGSGAKQVTDYPGGLSNVRFSPDGNYILFSKDVQLQNITGAQVYSDLPKSTVRIINDLNYRHWDTWEDGAYSHIFYATWDNGKISNEKDVMEGQLFDSPQMPFGGIEDFYWHTDSKHFVYVVKEKTGKEYAVSTNTDILLYDIEKGTTTNITEGNLGYDTNPVVSPDGNYMAYLSMQREGYEADKNRLFVVNLRENKKVDVSKTFDENVDGIHWSADSKTIYFLSPIDGTEQIFTFNNELYFAKVDGRKENTIAQLTKGDFDITGVIGETKDGLLVSRMDMNHATEIFYVNKTNGAMKQVTNVNTQTYDALHLSKTERKMVKTSDGKEMLVWFIYPPDFDPNKKYPTLLYCQGGPQSALTQFYSFRWNFQLMAANGYIVVAPNRRGMPGHGTAWNEEISKDWGGQAIQDYLSAIDYAKTLPYVDGARCGAVGASYGGYSVYMLAGVHEGRFKTFIAHDGLFNLESFYGTTEEMWFANWDMGGPYWEEGIQDKSYTTFNPINYVQNWDTPILIYQGGRDYRTTEDQAFQAFNAAQLRGVKSRFIYLPDENHWVLSCHNALTWQREFYKWLQETL
ncbi:MAG: S9 family peptidase [Chitinophagales bacterium]